jgi:hypothetical protein
MRNGRPKFLIGMLITITKLAISANQTQRKAIREETAAYSTIPPDPPSRSP